MNKDNIDAFFESLTTEELKEKWENYNYLSPPRFVDINVIASVTKDGSIGDSQSNGLLKTSKEDFEVFKGLTEGNTVIMGRKTWESLPNKPLPNRLNIVVSSTLENQSDAFVVNTLERAIDLSYGKIFVVGGAQLYAEAFKYFPTLILSVWHDRSLTGDVKFPKGWEEILKDYKRKSVKFKKEFNLEKYENRR